MTGSPVNSKISANMIAEYRGQLLDWYAKHERPVPWRTPKGQTPNPYYIWLSEIMCQQTTVQAVKPYYEKFITKWPTVADLAKADNEEVMAAWAGLGYYARARNLHKCAQIVANDLNGEFPTTQSELIKLPGIGEYTSAAIAAIAFNRPATVVDGNVERVMARFFAIEDPLPKSKKTLKACANTFFADLESGSGDLAQALMDLGSAICIPKVPRCVLCPIQDGCLAKQQGIAADLPRKVKKSVRPQKCGFVYWVTNDQNQVLFQKRPNKGLLGGMTGLPTSEWKKNTASPQHLKFIKFANATDQSVHHTFTHFDLELRLFYGKVEADTKLEEQGYFWAENIIEQAENLPSVFKKPYKLFRTSS